MDYAAEQEMEMEALEPLRSVVAGSVEYSGTVPDGWSSDSIYRVTLKPTEEDEQVERKLILDFLFAFTSTYPDEAPNIRIQSSHGLSDEEVSEVQSLVEEEVQMNLGMAMMFNIFESAKEWLRNRANVDASFSLTEEEKKRLREEEEEKRMAEQRSHGVPVTVETFEEWKVAFDEEMRKNNAKSQKTQQDPRLSRPTGKQLFQQRLAQVEDEDMDGDEDGSTQFEEEEEIDFDDDDDDEEWTERYLEQNA